MRTFAFIEYFSDIKQLQNYPWILRIVPGFLKKNSTKESKTFVKAFNLDRVRSTQGKEIEGYFIVCSTPHLEAKTKEESLLEILVEASQLARKLGVRLLGLGENIACAGNKAYNLERKLKLPVTNGGAFYAWSLLEAVFRASRARGIDLKKTNAAVVGAATPFGSLFSRKLASYISGMVIADGNPEKLQALKQNILSINPVEVMIETDLSKAAKNVDVVFIFSSSGGIEEFKPGAVICDATSSGELAVRKDLARTATVIKGGLIKMPYPVRLGIKSELPEGVISASLAETMLLSFEERFTSYSLGENFNLDKIEEIADIAVQHGFEVWAPGSPIL